MAYIIAILFPGGGYFYTRHYLIGVLNAIVEIFLAAYIVLILKGVLIWGEGIISYPPLLAAIFVVVKIISVIHSSHFIEEFIPRKKIIEANPDAAKPRPVNEDVQTEDAEKK